MAIGHDQIMNDLYRIQRHFYDATRKLFLPGRDSLLDRIDVPPQGAALEIGCGTGRNLIKLARRFPEAHFYGVDISSEMLRTARRKILQSGLTQIHIELADAETFDPRRLFGLSGNFDAVVFSYSLSMIADWRKAVDIAFRNLTLNGSLYIVDFWDQEGWPAPVRRLLVRWLSFFHVRYETGMIDYLISLAKAGASLRVQPLFGRYAFIATLSRK
jgi:S-adenosylmethionine-diacylgycerolhomoserine-N-methlytransferase